MTLGEKIYKLRKEKGLSQEGLAEKVGTTRQAISKWENDQGYPETEKLLLLSNVFEVSTDYLLKDEKMDSRANDRGFYVSKEMARGYIASERRVSKYLGIGFAFFAMAGIPYIAFPSGSIGQIIGIAFFVVGGIAALVGAIFASKDEYEVLKKECLILDYDFMRMLTVEHKTQKRKMHLVAVPCTVLFVACLVALAFTVRGRIPWTDYHVLIFLSLAVGVYGFVYTAGAMEPYEVLVNNDAYAHTFIFKLRRKFRTMIDRW